MAKRAPDDRPRFYRVAVIKNGVEYETRNEYGDVKFAIAYADDLVEQGWPEAIVRNNEYGHVVFRTFAPTAAVAT